MGACAAQSTSQRHIEYRLQESRIIKTIDDRDILIDNHLANDLEDGASIKQTQYIENSIVPLKQNKFIQDWEAVLRDRIHEVYLQHKQLINNHPKSQKDLAIKLIDVKLSHNQRTTCQIHSNEEVTKHQTGASKQMKSIPVISHSIKLKEEVVSENGNSNMRKSRFMKEPKNDGILKNSHKSSSISFKKAKIRIKIEPIKRVHFSAEVMRRTQHLNKF